MPARRVPHFAVRTSQRKIAQKAPESTGAFCSSRIGNWPIIECPGFVVYQDDISDTATLGIDPQGMAVNFSSWTNWLILAVGTLVTGLVFAVLYLRWAGLRGLMRRRSRGSAQAVSDEDLPWEDLLELLRRRGRELADSASPPDEDLPPEELLQLLLRRLPTLPQRPPAPVPQEELDFLVANPDSRTSRRRWGNPTGVLVNSPLWEKPLHGLVMNRSATGLAVFLDMEIQEGTFLKVRSVEAPYYVPWVDIEVKYARKMGRNFILGCQYRFETAWNVRVWFG